jgi:hypothetical protein
MVTPEATRQLAAADMEVEELISTNWSIFGECSSIPTKKHVSRLEIAIEIRRLLYVRFLCFSPEFSNNLLQRLGDALKASE